MKWRIVRVTPPEGQGPHYYIVQRKRWCGWRSLVNVTYFSYESVETEVRFETWEEARMALWKEVALARKAPVTEETRVVEEVRV